MTACQNKCGRLIVIIRVDQFWPSVLGVLVHRSPQCNKLSTMEAHCADSGIPSLMKRCDKNSDLISTREDRFLGLETGIDIFWHCDGRRAEDYPVPEGSFAF